MSKRRVVVTGLGALTPIGNTAKEYWQLILGPMLLLVVLFARGGIDGLLASFRRG